MKSCNLVDATSPVVKVAGSASILPSVNNMQVCNEYNYAHYEFH